jgi:hypothetical protein
MISIMDILPKEIIEEIFSYVDFVNTRAVCTDWKTMADKVEVNRGHIVIINQKTFDEYLNSNPNKYSRFIIIGGIFSLREYFEPFRNLTDKTDRLYSCRTFHTNGCVTTGPLYYISKTELISDCHVQHSHKMVLPGIEIIQYFLNKHPLIIGNPAFKKLSLKKTIDYYYNFITTSDYPEKRKAAFTDEYMTFCNTFK